MKRIRLSAGKKALVVVASLAAGASLVYGCIPSPDISGLPPYDASVAPGFDANALNALDTGADVGPLEDAGEDGPAFDGPTATGTISGVVIDYSQGMGRGVLAGATVSALNGPTTTTNAFGAFTLSGVPAGQVQINVSNPTNKSLGVAYSTTQLVLTLAGNQSVSVFPILHQGCYETFTGGSAGSVSPMTDGVGKCGSLESGADVWASLQFGATSFTVPSTGSLLNSTETARIEIIPIAFPLNSSETTDFTWGLGLPGATTPLKTIAATEIRVVDDSTGEPLAVTAGDTSVIATVTTSQLADTTTFQPFVYNATAGTWGAATGASLANAVATSHNDGPTIDQVDIDHVQQFGWLSVTSPGAPTTCLTGAVTANGSAAAGVWVHSTGLNYLGAASAVTNADGTFCLDVAAQGSADAGDAGPTPQAGIAAGVVSGSGVFFSLPLTAYEVSSLAGGTCANLSMCSSIGSIALTALNSTCVNGTATNAGADEGGVLDVELVSLTVSAAQKKDGMTATAYIGTTSLGDGGAFCAQAAAGQIELVEPAIPFCTSSSITVPSGGTATTCGGGGCVSVGAVTICE